jgi:hypothetical protein
MPAQAITISERRSTSQQKPAVGDSTGNAPVTHRRSINRCGKHMSLKALSDEAGGIFPDKKGSGDQIGGLVHRRRLE